MSAVIKEFQDFSRGLDEPRGDSPTPATNELAIRLLQGGCRKDFRLSQEGAGSWLMLYCVEGLGKFSHRHGALNLRKGDLALISPGAKASLELTVDAERWETVSVSFFPYPHWFSLLQWPEKMQGLRVLQFDDEKIQDRLWKCFLEALRIQARAEHNWEMSAMNTLERLLLLCESSDPGRRELQVDSRVLLAINYLSRHLAEPITLTGLAQLVGLSVPRLGQLFRQHMHQSPHRFLEKQRIAHARQILERTGETISIVAAEAGYSDPFHFARQFKKHTGFSPTEYRKRQLSATPGKGAGA